MHNRYKVNAEDFDGPVLLTGAGGCIGSWVLSLLVDAEVPVFALDVQKDTRRPKLLMSESELGLVKWLVGDISSCPSLNLDW
jgi:nucleoside-diphosphate-sugar epimerase